jgi:hypothetical protein
MLKCSWRSCRAAVGALLCQTETETEQRQREIELELDGERMQVGISSYLLFATDANSRATSVVISLLALVAEHFSRSLF